jgi:hypothetical protein
MRASADRHETDSAGRTGQVSARLVDGKDPCRAVSIGATAPISGGSTCGSKQKVK